MQQQLRATCWPLVMSLVLIATSALAGTNSFTSIGPDAGRINQVAFHPTNGSIAYVSTPNGFYRSTDGGITWTISPCTRGLGIQDFALDPTNVDRIFIATFPNGLAVSRDAGATCESLVGFAIGRSANNIEVSGDGTLYAVADDRLFRSTDAGVSWQERPRFTWLGDNTLRVDPQDSDVLFARFGDEAWRSTNAGMSWQAFSLPGNTRDWVIPVQTPQTILALTLDGISKSDNGGANWVPVVTGGTPLALAVDPNNPEVFYADVYPIGLFRSDNAGVNWINVHGNAPTWNIDSIAVSPVDSSLILMGGSEGLLRSSVGGGTWTSVNTGITATLIEKFVAAPASQRIYFLTSSNGIFALDHGATRAVPVNPEGLRAVASYTAPMFDLIVYGESADEVFVGMNGLIAHSNDGGENWGAIGLSMGAPDKISIAPQQPDQILISGGGGLFRSINDGATWHSINSLPASSRAAVFARPPSSTSLVYAGMLSAPLNSDVVSLGIYKSSSGGEDWAPINGSMPVGYVFQIEIDPRNEQIMYVSQSQGLFKSVNGGESWTAMSLGTFAPVLASISLHGSRAETIYASHSSKIVRSIDGGASWENVYVPTQSTDAAGRVIADPSRPNTILASLHGGAAEMTLATDVQIEANVPAALPMGAPHSLTFTIRNLGPLHATEVRTVIQLPSSASNVSASTDAGSCSVQAAVVTCTHSGTRVGQPRQITVSSTNSLKGAAEVVATVQASEADLQPSNNTVRHAVVVDQASDLSLTGSGPATMLEGSGISYSFVIANAGPQDAADVVATIELGAGLSFATATSSVGTCTSSSAGRVTCIIGTLGSGSNATVNVSTGVATRGTYATTVAVQGANADPAASNNSASVSTIVTPFSGGGGGGGPSGAGTGGGGGGGSNSWWFAALLACLATRKQSISRRSTRDTEFAV